MLVSDLHLSKMLLDSQAEWTLEKCTFQHVGELTQFPYSDK